MNKQPKRMTKRKIRSSIAKLQASGKLGSGKHAFEQERNAAILRAVWFGCQVTVPVELLTDNDVRQLLNNARESGLDTKLTTARLTIIGKPPENVVPDVEELAADEVPEDSKFVEGIIDAMTNS